MNIFKHMISAFNNNKKCIWCQK